MSIYLNNIFFSYKEKRILEDFNFNFTGYGTVVVTGINGSGKTTLLKLMAGILKPQQGVIKTYTVPNIGYVPDSPVLWENFSVKEQIDMMAKLYSVDIPHEIIQLINDLGLDFYEDIHAQNLSNGNRIKLNFILSILHYPDLLILDEVFNAADEVSIDIITHFLKQYAKSHVVVLASNRKELEYTSYDELIVLKDSL